MLSIAAYQIKEKIYEGPKILIYRGERNRDKKPVILKVLKAEYPSLNDIARLKHQFQITKDLAVDGVVKTYALEDSQNSMALVFEDMGGESLKNLISSDGIHPPEASGQTDVAAKGMSLKNFFRIGIRLSETLGAIHNNHIIHKDIKPANIIVNIKTEEVKITDFGIASRLSRESGKTDNPSKLEGSLPYIAPEQTGRMNRSVDYRSDLYSLGVTFYEMITAELPFHADDPMEMVHCHIARQPRPPHELKKEIPKAISEIVLKLLSKTAEGRYQSAYGIKADLEECMDQWESSGKIENFVPGQKDFSNTFQIPEKLYGREAEISILMDSFERVNRGTKELMLVTGFSGIGKSALIHEIHKPIVREKGYFISGKFDQFKRNIPYSSLILAFQDLIRQLITEREEKITVWKEKLMASLGPNGRVIIDVIQEVELIIGTQPDVPELSPAESQNRFNSVFRDFVRVFAQPDHPLAIFLDDLQWADSASLHLIHLLTTDPDTRFLLMIGAYRDNEIDTGHALPHTLDDIQKDGGVIHKISLGSLKVADLNQMASDTFNCSREKTTALAELLARKTDGNPFFVREFLLMLYKEGLLEFNQTDGQCQWDLDKINAKGFTGNVVELMTGKIQKLSENTRNALKLAACIGNRFDLKNLSIISEKTPEETADHLWEALQEDLLLPIGDSYKVFQNYEPKAVNSPESADRMVFYQFSHDRVQEAVYSLIPEDYKKEIHCKTGRLLLKNTRDDKLEESVFDILKQLNLSTELITDPEERCRLAELNLKAARKAKASTAYEAALKYLSMGIDLLSEDCFQSCYNRAIGLHMERAECEYLCGNFEEAKKFFDLILKNAKTRQEKAKVFNLEMVLCTNSGDNHKAVELGIQGLKLFGEIIPAKPGPVNIVPELLKIIWKLRNKKIENLIDLPDLKEPEKLSIMSLLMNLTVPAYFTSQDLLALVTMKMVNISLKYGNADISSYAYSCFGLIIGSGFGRYKAGYEFGQLALKVSQKYQNINYIGKCQSMFGIFLNIWRSHIRTNLDFCSKAYQHSMDCGNLIFAGYSADALIFSLNVKGLPLDDLFQKAQKYLDFANKIKDYDTANFFLLTQKKVLSLKGSTREPGSFSDDNFDEDRHLEEMKKSSEKVPVSWYYINKCQTLFIFEDFATAQKMAMESDMIIEVSMGQVFVPTHYFYYSLVLTALYPSASAGEKRMFLKTLRRNQKKMKRWADNCPENFLHQYLLIVAEMARISGDVNEALKLYDRSIKSARTNEFVQDEAIANELAAKFHLANGSDVIGRAYIREARFAYLKWGAFAKVKCIDEKYPQIASTRSSAGMTTTQELTLSTTDTTADSTSSSDSTSEVLDVATVIKASQALSGEIMLEKLLERLVKVVMENAGAQKGFLVLEKEGQLVIEAEGRVDKEDVAVLQSIPIETRQDLAEAIIRYVKRIGVNVVLNDVANEGMFTNDSYVLKNRPKSIMCVPIVYKGKLTGIFYLENNLTTGAFTPDRLEVLGLLSSQVAISIENARLYTNLEATTENLRKSHEKLEEYSHTLEQKVDERTADLRETMDELKKTNRELEESQEQLVQSEKMASLGQLVAGVAHEINTPIGIGVTAASYFEGSTKSITSDFEKNAMKKTDLVKYFSEAGKSCNLILKNLLRTADLVKSFKMVSADQTSQEKRVFNLKSYLNDIVMSLNPELKKRSHQVEVICSEDIQMDSFPGALAQVITNFIMNSINHAFTNDESGNIKITASREGHEVVLKYIDDGKGIPEENLKKIFDPFFTTKRGTGGTGLGLNIVFNIVNKTLGGRVECESEPEKGTTFTLHLPMRITGK